ncbi:MAG: hypothetical protein D6689_03850 [Deltaproteobacteria bacterium]|nr:MAG: hypothetical protein D6689_03850 [Deltaproteobacteria bacterium]
MHIHAHTADKSSIEGLWVLLVREPGSEEPNSLMMARAGNNETYLLGFKNAFNARRFIEQSAVEHAEPRMVVRSNKAEVLALASERGAVGVLVDYDPTTHDYARAAELY